jgi:hypothetical protein
MDVMRMLTAKYADGYEGWARQMGEEPVVKCPGTFKSRLA